MLTILPAQAWSPALPDSAEAVLPTGPEGAGFAAELALAVRGVPVPAPAPAAFARDRAGDGVLMLPHAEGAEAPAEAFVPAPDASGDATSVLDPAPEAAPAAPRQTSDVAGVPEPAPAAAPLPAGGAPAAVSRVDEPAPAADVAPETAAAPPATARRDRTEVATPTALHATALPATPGEPAQDQAPVPPAPDMAAAPPAEPDAGDPPATATSRAESPDAPAEAPAAREPDIARMTPEATVPDLVPAQPDARLADAPQAGPRPPEPIETPAPEALPLAVAAVPADRQTAVRPRPPAFAAASTPAAETPPAQPAATPPAAPAPPDAAPAEPTSPDAAASRPATAAPDQALPADAAMSAEPAEPTPARATEPDPPPARAEPGPPRAAVQPGTVEAPVQAQAAERPAPSAPASAPVRPPPAPPAQQIAPVLITLAAGNAGMPDSLTLTLDPQELGRIEVEVTREGEKRVAIAVLAERPETLHLLMRDAAALDRALAQAGVGTEGRSLAFDLGGDPEGRQQRGAGPGGRGASPAASQPEIAPRRHDPLSLLDIAI